MIDTHAHLDHIEDLDAAMSDARQSGVEAVMAVSVDLAAMKKNLDIQARFEKPQVYAALGVHPGNIKTEDVAESLQFIRAHLPEAHAIGEIGLDFWYKWVRKDDEKKLEQREVFARQLEIARESGLPAIIHTRGTWREAFETTRLAGVKKAVFHWYSGPVDVLSGIIDNGYFVSATPALAGSPQSREAIRHAPIEQTLIETDSPVYYRYRDREGGFEAGPKDIARTLAAYAELKNMDSTEARDILDANARAFFGMKGTS